MYFLGHGPQGDVLYREALPATYGQKPLALAVSSLMDRPTDPDYRTGWYPGTLVSASARHGVVRVELGPIPAGRPASMSQRTAYETVQQAVYTFQGATGRRDIKVQFLRHGWPAPAVLGVPTTHPVGPGPVGDVLSRMIIGSPSDGQLVQAGRLVVTGTNNDVKGRLTIRLVPEELVWREHRADPVRRRRRFRHPRPDVSLAGRARHLGPATRPLHARGDERRPRRAR